MDTTNNRLEFLSLIENAPAANEMKASVSAQHSTYTLTLSLSLGLSLGLSIISRLQFITWNIQLRKKAFSSQTNTTA